jgi:hypothetical protein
MSGETDAGHDAQNKSAVAAIPRSGDPAAPLSPVLAPPARSFRALSPDAEALQKINRRGATITDLGPSYRRHSSSRQALQSDI